MGARVVGIREGGDVHEAAVDPKKLDGLLPFAKRLYASLQKQPSRPGTWISTDAFYKDEARAGRPSPPSGAIFDALRALAAIGALVKDKSGGASAYFMADNAPAYLKPKPAAPVSNGNRYYAEFDAEFDADLRGPNEEAALKAYVQLQGGGTVSWAGADDEGGEDFQEFYVRIKNRDYNVRVFKR